MNPEAQRIAIAEWCGWKWGTPVFQHDGKWHSIPHTDTEFDLGLQIDSSWAGTPHDVVRDEWMLPDYLNDLNAMHEAEIRLNGPDRERFAAKLYTLVIGSDNNLILGRIYEEDLALVSSATATQRAEALLRTIGKWQE